MKFFILIFSSLLATPVWAANAYSVGAYVLNTNHIENADGTVTNYTTKLSVISFDENTQIYHAVFRYTDEDRNYDMPMDVPQDGAEKGIDISNCEADGGQLEELLIDSQLMPTCHYSKDEEDRQIELWIGNVFGGVVKMSNRYFSDGRSSYAEVKTYTN